MLKRHYLTEDMDRRSFLKMLGRGISLTGLSPSSVAKIATNLSTPLPAKPADILGAFKTMYEMTDRFWTRKLTSDAAKDTLQKFNGSLLTLLGAINKGQRKHDGINYYERIIKQMQVREKQLLSYGSEGYIPDNFVSDFYDDDFFGEVVYHHSLLTDLYKSGAITKDIEKYLITGLPSKYGVPYYNAYQVIGSREYARTGKSPDDDEVTRILEKEYPDHVDPEEVERLNAREKYEKERLEQEEKDKRSERGSRFDYAGSSEDVGYAKYYEKANLKFNDLVLMLEDTEDDMLVKGIDIYNTLHTKIYMCRVDHNRWDYNEASHRFIRPIMYMYTTTIIGVIEELIEQAAEDDIPAYAYVFDGDVIVRMDVDTFREYLMRIVYDNKIAHFTFVDPARFSQKRYGSFISKDHDQMINYQLSLYPGIDVCYYRELNNITPRAQKGIILQNGTVKICNDIELDTPIDASYRDKLYKFKCRDSLLQYIPANHTHLLLTGKQILYIMDNVVKDRKTVQLDVKDRRDGEMVTITYSPFDQ